MHFSICNDESIFFNSQCSFVIHGCPVAYHHRRLIGYFARSHNPQTEGPHPEHHYYNPISSLQVEFQELVFTVIGRSYQGSMPIFYGQVEIIVDFYFKRPLTHFFRNTRTPEELRFDYVNAECVSGHQTDDLLKFVLDGIEPFLYTIDTKIMRITTRQLYCDNEDERTHIICRSVSVDE